MRNEVRAGERREERGQSWRKARGTSSELEKGVRTRSEVEKGVRNEVRAGERHEERGQSWRKA